MNTKWTRKEMQMKPKQNKSNFIARRGDTWQPITHRSDSKSATVKSGNPTRWTHFQRLGLFPNGGLLGWTSALQVRQTSSTIFGHYLHKSIFNLSNLVAILIRIWHLISTVEWGRNLLPELIWSPLFRFFFFLIGERVCFWNRWIWRAILLILSRLWLWKNWS